LALVCATEQAFAKHEVDAPQEKKIREGRLRKAEEKAARDSQATRRVNTNIAVKQNLPRKLAQMHVVRWNGVLRVF
jgi:hypothetical protein